MIRHLLSFTKSKPLYLFLFLLLAGTFSIAQKSADKNRAKFAPVKPVVLNTLAPNVPQTCVYDQTVADFNQGSVDLNTFISSLGDGEITLKPALYEDFSGNSIPPRFMEGIYNAGGTTFSNGSVTVDGIHLYSNDGFGPGSTLEFTATFNLGAFQNVGFSNDQVFDTTPWMVIGQGGSPDGDLYARAYDGTSISLGSNLLGAPHTYKIKWNANSFDFYVDGSIAPVATINLSIGSPMFLQISDFQTGDGTLSVDKIRLLPYATAGSYTSRVFDGAYEKNWGTTTWTADVPTGTLLSVYVRAGNTQTPDASWTSWKQVPASGTPAGVSGEYIQYRIDLATTDNNITPVLKGISIECNCSDLTAPVITTKNITVQADSTGVVTINPNDVIVSITDNKAVDNLSVTVSQTQFSCKDQFQAYIANTNMGNQVWFGTLGMEFKVVNPGGININQLGVFDHMGDGIHGTQNGGVRVSIWDKSTLKIISGLDANIIGMADHYSYNHRMKDVAPVHLPAGDYVVVTLGYNATELNGNSIGMLGFPPGDLGQGSISYIGTSRYKGDNDSTDYSFPNVPDELANQYLAGTFGFTTGGPGEGGDNTVTVTAKDYCGNVGQTTATVTLVCNVAPTVTTPPVSKQVCDGTQVSFYSSATGKPEPTVQWQFSTDGSTWTNISGATNATLTFTAVLADNNKQYRAVWTNVQGSVNSSAATLTVYAIPVAGINSSTTVLTCATPSINVTATGGGTYKWEDNSTSATRTLTAAGTYTVTVTGTGGCTATKSIVITTNKTAPSISPLSCGTLSCINTLVSVTASATGQGALSYAWSGGTQGSSANIRIFTVAGNYSVTVTDAANGCSTMASVTVGSIVSTPVADITNNSGTTVLTCTTGAINVTATGGGTYKWEDNSTSATRTLTVAGTYTVTVTGGGGCTATKSIVITSNKTAPSISPLSCSTLSCINTSVSVAGSATGQGALSYVWSGGTQGSSANIRIFTIAGNYSVTVTDAANGCSSMASLTVGSSVSTPVAAISNNSGTTVLTCTTGAINVTATGGGIYKWEDNSTSATRTLTAAGTYTVTVTGGGGCTASKSIVITSNKTAPSISPLSCGTLSCINASVSVTASAMGQGALSYVWSGGTQGSSANIRIFTVAGNYSVTVTDAANGCSSMASVTVGSIVSTPVAAISNNTGTTILTCTTSAISVTATGGGTYKWEDNSTNATRTLTAAGTYTVTVTGGGGCTASKSIVITSNKTAPSISPLSCAALSCSNTSVSVTASATGQGALSYVWSGGTQGSSANIHIFTVAGNYSVTVTDAANGCSSMASVNVSGSSGAPVAAITNNTGTTTLTCTTSAISVTATGGGTYKWEDNSTNATRTLTAAGTYTVTVTGSGGCTATKSIVITSNKTAPSISQLSCATLTCSNTSVSVTASATGQGALSYVWSGGTQGASANIRIFTAAGNYSVAVTDAANGCSSIAWVTVSGSTVLPTLTSSLTPTATSETVFNYTAASSLSGTTFSWSRAAVDGISNSAATGSGAAISETLVNTTKSAITVVYVFTLKYNGCTNTQNVVVKVNPPGITCITTSCISSNYYSCGVPAGKFLWISSVFNPCKLGSSGKVNFYIYNSKITYNGNNGPVTINLPFSHIVYDPAATTASTRFVNNVWETVIPFSFSKNAFMNGISYPVPAGGINGGMRYASWTADIAVDKAGVELSWKTTFAQYSSLANNAGLNIKPVDGSLQNPYCNNDPAGTPENYCSYYNNNNCYSDAKTVYCNCNSYSQRSSGEVDSKNEKTTEHLAVAVMPNPSKTTFTIIINSNSSNKSLVMLRVLDSYGRVVAVHEKVQPDEPIRLGQSWAAGAYFAEVIQGKEKQVVKLIKTN